MRGAPAGKIIGAVAWTRFASPTRVSEAQNDARGAYMQKIQFIPTDIQEQLHIFTHKINGEWPSLSYPSSKFCVVSVCVVCVWMDQYAAMINPVRQFRRSGRSVRTNEQGPRFTTSQENKAPVW